MNAAIDKRVSGVALLMLGFGVNPAPGGEAPAASPESPATSTPAPPGAGTLSGTIVVPSGRSVPEMVVFLAPRERADAPEPGGDPSPAPSAATTEGNKFVITQKDAKFIPNFLVVPVGSTVEFRNEEPTDLEHNVFSRSEPKTFDLGLYGPKDPPKTVTFDKLGEVSIYCSVHRYMDATVFVTPTAHFSMPDKDGRFEIKDVPAGAWTLRTWQRRKRLTDAEIDVSIVAGETSRVRVELKR